MIDSIKKKKKKQRIEKNCEVKTKSTQVNVKIRTDYKRTQIRKPAFIMYSWVNNRNCTHRARNEELTKPRMIQWLSPAC